MTIKKIKKILFKKTIEKKEYSNLNTEFINKIIDKVISSNQKGINKLLNNLKSETDKKNQLIENNKEIKKLIKQIRAEIGERYGQFLTSKFNKKQNKILEKIEKLTDENIEELLKLHKSTRERSNFYHEIYSKIIHETKDEIQNILDLACGLNPISIYYIEKIQNKKINNYIGIDLNKKDMEFLNQFYKKFNYPGEFYNLDLTNLEWIKKIQNKNIDTIFLLKALDSFEKDNKNISKKIISKLLKIKTINQIIISFPTKSIKAKEKFNKNKRNWFFNFLEKENLEYNTFEIENELFIIIHNNKK